MALVELKKEATDSELRWFGLLFAGFFGLIGAMTWWRFDAPHTAQYIWVVAGGVAGLYYLIPPLRRPIFFGWMYAAYPIGFVVSHVILAGIYYLVMTPIGLLMRLLGHDPLQLRLKPDAETHWIKRTPSQDPQRYFNQY